MKELKKDKEKIKRFKKLKRKFWFFVMLINLVVVAGIIYFLVLLSRMIRNAS